MTRTVPVIALKHLFHLFAFLLSCNLSAQDSDRYLFFENGLWGYIDHTGNEPIPAVYHSAGKFSEGLAAVRKGPYYGYIDPSGKTVIRSRYDFAGPFRNGTAVVYTGERQVLLISKKGKKLAGPYLQIVKLLDTKQLLVESPEGYGVLDSAGNVIIQPAYDEVKRFSDGRWLLGIHDTAGTRYGLAASDGTIITKPDQPNNRLRLQFLFDRQKNKQRMDSLATATLQQKQELRQDCDYRITENAFCYSDSTGRVVKGFSVPAKDTSGNYDYRITFSTWPGRTIDTPYIRRGEAVDEDRPPAELLVEISENGPWVTIINQLPDTLWLPVTNESLELAVQARTEKGEWRDITVLPSKGDYMTQDLFYLGFLESMRFPLPEMQGGIRAELRVRLTCFATFDAAGRTAQVTKVYSNVFKGTINPGQLWNTQRTILIVND